MSDTPLWCRLFGHAYDWDDRVCTRCGAVPSHLARAFTVFGSPANLVSYIEEYERQRKGTLYETTFVYRAIGNPEHDPDLVGINAETKPEADDIVADRQPAGVRVEYVGELNQLATADTIGVEAEQ